MCAANCPAGCAEDCTIANEIDVITCTSSYACEDDGRCDFHFVGAADAAAESADSYSSGSMASQVTVCTGFPYSEKATNTGVLYTSVAGNLATHYEVTMVRGASNEVAPFTLCEDAPVYSRSVASAFRVNMSVFDSGTTTTPAPI